MLAAVDGGLGANPAAKVFQVSMSWIYKARARRRSTWGDHGPCPV